MNQSLLGGIVPIWIIGAPLVFAIIELMRTPKPSPDHRRADLPSASAYTAAPRQAPAL